MRKRKEVMERVGWRRNRLTAREINRQIDRWKAMKKERLGIDRERHRG